MSKSTTKRCEKMKPGYVYFITFADAEFRSKIPAIKIGSTYDIDKRMRSLSTGSPIPLMLIGFLVHDPPSQLEAKLQYEFRRFRMKGEWFTASAEMLENIKKLDPKFSVLDDLFNFDEEISSDFLVQRLRERIDKKDAVIKDLLKHIKNVDPEGYPIVYQRLINGRPLHMQKRLRAK
jgi:hypothetical protein